LEQLISIMEIISVVGISFVVSLSVSIFVKIAIGVKWTIDINEITARREKEKSTEYRILSNWWNSEKCNLSFNNKGKLIVIGDNRKKYKRYLKLTKLYNKGKLQQ